MTPISKSMLCRKQWRLIVVITESYRLITIITEAFYHTLAPYCHIVYMYAVILKNKPVCINCLNKSSAGLWKIDSLTVAEQLLVFGGVGLLFTPGSSNQLFCRID